MYVENIGEHTGRPLKIELLAHHYAWESYHSTLNRAGGALVPSRRFSEAFDLRGLPGTFDQALPDGSLASRSCSAPSGFTGNVLYLREDLLRTFAGKRVFVGLVWGERQIDVTVSGPGPDWLVRAREEDADLWKQVFGLDERSLPPRPPKARKRHA